MVLVSMGDVALESDEGSHKFISSSIVHKPVEEVAGTV